MNANQHNEELIDLYLREELSGDELQAFENQLSNDQAFRQQVAFQKDIAKGLTNYRRMQLKTRLDAIEVGSGWYSGGLVSQGLMKIAASLAVVTVIGAGVYYTWPDIDNTEYSTTSETKLDITKSAEALNNLAGEVPDVPEPADAEVGSEAVNSASPKVVHAKKVKANKPSKKVSPEVTGDESQVAKSDKEYVPTVDRPSLNDVAEDKEFTSEDISIPEVSNSDIIRDKDNEPIDIKTYNRKSGEIRYKYFSGKLYLYGDFKQQPYEILEINSKTSRQIYLYYSDKYYEVEVTDEIKTLRPIASDNLINDLKIIRDNKLN